MHYKRWQQHGATEHLPRRCENCVATFIPRRSDQAFCSRLCNELARGVRKYGPRGSVVECAVCGERRAVEFGPGVPGGQSTKCCSLECREEWERRKGQEWRTANRDRCRERDRLRGSRAEYHRVARRRRQMRAAAQRCAEIACDLRAPGLLALAAGAAPVALLPAPRRVVAGRAVRPLACAPEHRVFIAGLCREAHRKPFVASVGRGDQFCSPLCCRRNHRRRDRARRRAQERGGPRIDLAAVAARDGWRCHICKRKVSRKAWSLDHLVPLSDGGKHVLENVALAHHLCNSLRGARGAAQLRLAA